MLHLHGSEMSETRSQALRIWQSSWQMAAFMAAPRRDAWFGRGDRRAAWAKAAISIRPLGARLGHLSDFVGHLAAERRLSDVACVRIALA